VFVHQLSEYQARKREDKQHESARRQTTLKSAVTDITPENKGVFPWTAAQNNDKFEDEWSMKPV